MMIIDGLSLLLLILLPVSGSGIELDSLNTSRDVNLTIYGTTQVIDVYGKTEKVDERQMIGKEAQLTRDSNHLASSVLSSVEPDGLIYQRSPWPKEKDSCSPDAQHHPCRSKISFSVSTEVSLFVSSSVSAAVSSSVAMILTSSLTAAMRAAHDEGFRDGQSQASENARSSIDAVRASASSILESIFSTARSTSSAGQPIPSIVGDFNKVSHSVVLDAGQLAGIVVGVFLVSSILSVLTTVFFLWYRRRKAPITHTTGHAPIDEKRQTNLGKLRDIHLPFSSAAATTTRRHDDSKLFTTRLKRGRPSQTQQKIRPANRASFVSPLSPGSKSDHILPVSPLSGQLQNSPGRGSSPSLGLGLYGNRARVSLGSKASNMWPLGFPLSRNTSQAEYQQTPVVHAGGHENKLSRLVPNVWIPQMFSSNGKFAAFTDSRGDTGIRDAASRVEGGMAASTPITSISALSPPIVPVRFSSLNARISLPIQNPGDSQGNDGTFLLSTDEESGDRDARPPEDQSGFQSSSNSSIILQDLTQFDPVGPRIQPASRFSTSSAPLSSLDSSASSSSPIPQYNHQQQDNPVISPLRPAPPSPSLLQSPLPRRHNAASALASLEPPIHGDS